ncbi:MAG TPA: DnaJ domain-containing protein [Acidobacteriota bacterium]|nr:DnaJ domain-containing protein [Acidobacteriota bacterium]
MLQMYHWDELRRACQVLFGSDLVIDQQFLLALDRAHLKKAYRQRALATHPDRLAGRGDGRLFIEVNEAYQKLSRHLTQYSKASAIPNLRRPEPVYTSPDKDPEDGRIYQPERVPCWPLRTGEYLYFSGVVSWQTLISALVWQRRQRLALGEIARRWGWLSEEELFSLLGERKNGERLGEILLRHGLINEFQLNMMLRHQQKNQKPLGRYFIEQNLFSELQLARYLEDLKRHNSKWRRS